MASSKRQLLRLWTKPTKVRTRHAKSSPSAIAAAVAVTCQLGILQWAVKKKKNYSTLGTTVYEQT